MPNRIIRESICSSDSIKELSWFEEVFFYRLIVNCDDYGRLDARTAILQSKLFPLNRSITEKQIDAALDKLSTVGIVSVYKYDGKPYLQLVTWEKYQTIRNKKSKYPDPPIENEYIQKNDESNNLPTVENNCKQLQADVAVIQSNPNPIQSESESEDIMHVADKSASLPVVSIILNDKSYYSVFMEDVTHWKELYPAVDIEQELRAMVGWCESNPTKRKTKSGVKKFINAWLAKTQDRGGVSIGKQQYLSTNLKQNQGQIPKYGESY